MALKNPFIVFEHDVYALTSQGEEELRGAETSLSPGEIELLVRTDGNTTVAEISASMQTLPADAVIQACAKLARAGLLDLASNIKDDSLDFTDFFSEKPRPAPSAAELTKAGAEASTGVSALQEQGYYVRIARRAGTMPILESGQRLSAIVIEDDPNLGKFLKTYLSFDGFDVRLATNREEIINALREPPLPNLVLLDVMLPDADGFEILQKMRQHSMLRPVPVIMLTAKATREAVLKGLAGGADGYITKPFEPDTLMKAVKAVLGLPKGLRSPARS